MKTIKLLVAAVVTSMAAVAGAVTGNIQSIYSIPTEHHTFPNQDDPVTIGQEVRFGIRLLNNEYQQGRTNSWRVTYQYGMGGTGSEAADAVLFPPSIGIYVSGKLKPAKIVEVRPNATVPQYCTDLICSYTAVGGDIALPVTLADENGNEVSMSLSDSDVHPAYYLYYNYMWSISDASGLTNAVLAFGTQVLSKYSPMPVYRDYSLGQAGICIQTIDFDEKYVDEAATTYTDYNGDEQNERVWRKVYEGMSTTTTTLPSIVVPGGVATNESYVTLYLWTDNTNGIALPAASTKWYGNHLAQKITLQPGQTNLTIQVNGIKNGEYANLYLSASPTNIYSSTIPGLMITNFVKRTLKCVEAPNPFISITFAETADTTYKTTAATTLNAAAGIPMLVTLSKAFTSDVVVNLNPKLPSGVDVFDENLIGLSSATVQNNNSWRLQNTTVTIPAGSTTATFYVYPLGGIDETVSEGICFTPSVTGTAYDFYKGYDDYVSSWLYISDCTPIITAPSAGQAYPDVDMKSGVTMPVAIQDSFRDLSNGTYTATCVFSGSAGSGSSTVTGLKFSTSGLTTDVNFTCPTKSGEYENSYITVTDPNGNTSDKVYISVTVTAPRTISVGLYNTSDQAEPNQYTKYAEGDEPIVRFQLNQAYASDLYAFLVPLNEATSNLVESKVFTQGLKITMNATNSITREAWTLKFLDGCDDAADLEFGIMVRDSELITEGNEITDACSTEPTQNPFCLSVTNVCPAIAKVTFNNEVIANGGTAKTVAAASAKNAFSATLSEVSSIDVASGMITRWTFQDGSATYPQYKQVYVTNTTVTTTCGYTFKQGGFVHHVTVEVQDKDMLEKDQWSPLFEFDVNVDQKPYVVVSSSAADNHFLEGDVTGYLSFGLSTPPDDDVEIEITVDDSGVTDGGQMGLKYYTVTIPAGDTLPSSIWLTDNLRNTDGTPDTFTSGFIVTAKVITDTENQFGTKYSEYYGETAVPVYIDNVIPTISKLSDYSIQTDTAKTNTTYAIGDSYTLQIKVNDASPIDLNTKGLTIYVEGNEVGVIKDKDLHEFIIPNAFKESGVNTLEVTVDDGDGGEVTKTLFFDIATTKAVTVNPYGPSTRTYTKFRSYRTLKAGGLGKGRVWSNANAVNVEEFRHTYQYGVKVSQALINAYGYPANVDVDGNPVAYLDNGNLLSAGKAGMDIAIDEYGDSYNPASGAGYFTYDGVLDNFFYCWVDESQTACLDTTLLTVHRVPAPTLYPTETSTATIFLDAFEKDKESYETKNIEAIFSREYLASDNLGDINGDGVPDYLATLTWTSGNVLAKVANGEGEDFDLPSVAAYNGDGDLMPGVVDSAPGEAMKLKEGNSYAPIGKPFNAIHEIRGYFGNVDKATGVSGLNYFDTNSGKYISDRALSEDEEKGFLAAAEANGVDTGDAAALDAFWASRAWTPENPTDPTVDDTDQDGFTDGWEYFFWYRASVGQYVVDGDRGTDANGDQYMKGDGSRFNYADITKGLRIPAEDIMNTINPTAKYEHTDDFSKGDLDGDGLSDYEEYIIGTDPTNWDTDGDQMCDGWEVMMCLDPLNGKDYDSNVDGDFMAYFSFTGKAVMHHTAATPLAGLPQDDDHYGWYLALDLVAGNDYIFTMTVDEKGNITGVADGEVMVNKATRFALLWLDTNTDPTITLGNERVPAHRTFPQSNGSVEIGQIVYIADFMDLALVHDQVYAMFGFDPRTAWYMNRNGYVADRWDPEYNSDNIPPSDRTGAAVNTREYKAIDEYLLFKYRFETGVFYPADKAFDAKKIWDTIAVKTTCPSVSSSITIEGTNTTADAVGGTNITTVTTTTSNNNTQAISEWLAQAFAAAGSDKQVKQVHGADTDGDGVPDGWELYVFRNPCIGYGKEEDGMMERDRDSDYITYPMEYAGLDSCYAYQNCETIFANVPKYWFNKFFPTDPDNPDTDGDGIMDGVEGCSETMDPMITGVFEGMAYTSFCYGQPVYDKVTVCFRGGGTNPNTWDTDLDGLPDPWETSYPGVPVDLATKKYTPPPGADNVDLEIPDYAFMQAGVFNKNATGVIMLGGMDATWKGDACTDPVDAELGMSWDPITQCCRDTDFDLDGLQNYQEYRIQAMRHFRWDDMYSPLMGRVMTPVDYTINPLSGDVTVNTVGAQRFWGFARFDPSSAKQTAINCAAVWDGVTALEVTSNLVTYAMVTNALTGIVQKMPVFDVVTNVLDGSGVAADLINKGILSDAMWAYLGYYQRPPHSFDRTIACGYVMPYYMLPPSGAGYVSTSPKSFDTDGDGMDDYYEMFHGLNPLLGSASPGMGDVIASSYGVPNLFNAFWNEWTHPDFVRVLPLMFNIPGSFARVEPITQQNALDFVMYPWANGGADVDADGDGLRNEEEKLLANIASPQPAHTDPTPLWMTDLANPGSYTSQYYPLGRIESNLGWNPAIWWPNLHLMDEFSMTTYEGFNLAICYSFEQNEGYDTDNDMQPDGREIIQTVKSTSDPLKYTDPDRRQAMWFDGEKSAAITREMQYRGMRAGDLLRQFTVECWVRPEKTGVEQTILERSSAYDMVAMNKEASGVIRANFRIGLDKDGRVYGLFDNTDAIKTGLNQPVSCQRVDGPSLDLNEWTHVALTYDGATLRLYVNGNLKTSADTTLIPANGITQLNQNIASTNAFPIANYAIRPTAFMIGARPLNAVGLTRDNADWANLEQFYQGFVDEVRVWDGARTSSQIKSSYTKRFTFQDVADNRDDVYMVWQNGGTRNSNDRFPTLPAELLQHYNFQNLPGAVNAADVAKNVVGFDTAVAEPALMDAAAFDLTGLYPNTVVQEARSTLDLNVGWWAYQTPLHSTVYDDYRMVPWIQNTVAHLPMYDGSCIDSFYYNDTMAGTYVPATQHGLSEFTFPNTANPYHFYSYGLDPYIHLFQLGRLAEQGGEAYDPILMKFQYEVRGHFITTSDMIPLGAAFAKTCDSMWDDGSAADLWEYTGTDTDADGLPDWWETVAAAQYGAPADLNWDTEVTYHGVKMSAAKAYTIDLARGMQPDGSINTTYASTVDVDGDNLPDWWEKMFGVEKYGAYDDPDNDGLSNYAEFLISFGSAPYGMDNGFPLLDPSLARTGVVQKVTDYFLPGPDHDIDATGKHISANSYLGEIVTDHDYMEDWWEQQFPVNYVNSRVYDPLDDADEDGWSNFAENRYAMWHADYSADRIDKYTDGSDATAGNTHIACYPEPAIGVKVTYHGTVDISSMPLVIRTATTAGRIDATFQVAATAESQTKYIGPYREGAVLHTFLSPGSVLPNSVELQAAVASTDKSYRWSWEYYDQNGIADHPNVEVGDFATYKAYKLRYPNIELQGASFTWEKVATSVSDSRGDTSSIIWGDSAVSVGTLDCETGELALDMALVYQASTNVNDLASTIFQVSYSSNIGQEWPQTIWVSDVKEYNGTGAVTGSGRVKEGSNTIEAFIDLNGDGVYTAGEPFGVAKGVQVGWHRTSEIPIELKDTSAIVPRFNIADGSVDRIAVNGSNCGVIVGQETLVTNEDGSVSIQVDQAAAAGDGLTRSIQIIRKQINGIPAKNRILMSKTFIADDRAYIHEGDIVSASAGRYDLDWSYLASDAEETIGPGTPIQNVKYAIEEVVATVDGGTTNMQIGSFIRTFSAARGSASVVAPTQGQPIYSAAPTFLFSCDDETATAFEVQVQDASSGDVVFDSGVQVMPARTGTTVGTSSYSYTPAIYADNMMYTNGAAIFTDGIAYKWRVAVMNSAYPKITLKEEDWSPWGDFQMDVGNVNRNPQIPTGYGLVGAAVRYYGPSPDAVANRIVVEAYDSADLTGQPLSQMRLADIADLRSLTDVSSANVTLKGIRPGVVYLCAYIDINNNGVRDNWEPWGYSNNIGTDDKSIYTPEGITVSDSLVKCPTTVLYIEDCDVNKNEIPDCLEPDNFRGSSTSGGGGDGGGGGGGGGGSGGTGGDADRDGLQASIETEIGTNPGLWDTDGDGMPDGWEAVFTKSVCDPLFADGGIATSDDVMAYAEIERTLLTVMSTEDGSKTEYLLPEGALTPNRGDDLTGMQVNLTYNYGAVKGLGRLVTLSNTMARVMITVTNTMPEEVGTEYTYILPAGAELEVGTNFVAGVKAYNYTGADPYHLADQTNLVLRTYQTTTNMVSLLDTNVTYTVTNVITVTNFVVKAEEVPVFSGENRVASINGKATVALVHAQVYDKFGFDTSTAVAMGGKNTKLFTALDKYLVVRYLEAIGLASENDVNINQKWASYTLCPKNLDYDCDGIPDGWELYTMFGPDGAGSVASLADVQISPWVYEDARKASPSAEDPDFRLIDEWDRGNVTDPWSDDTDNDGIKDNIAYSYHLKGAEAQSDNDNDGLSNFSEYVISEVFGYAKLSPDKAYSDGQTLDYFRRVGMLYLGEMFSDHDQVEDDWESLYATSGFVSRYVWDATSDNDEDGWSARSEARYSQFKAPIRANGVSHVIGTQEVLDVPVPTIATTIRYNGAKSMKASGSALAADDGTTSVSYAPIVIKTYTKPTGGALVGSLTVADAEYKIQPGATEARTAILGIYTNRIVRGTLAPGHVDAASIKLKFGQIKQNDNYTWSDSDGVIHTGSYYDYENAYALDKSIKVSLSDFAWNQFIDADTFFTTVDDSSGKGYITMKGIRVGTVNVDTGDYEFDLDCLKYVYTGGTNATDVSQITSMTETLLALDYTTTVPGSALENASKLELWLGKADSGYVKEGENTIVAFADLDGDGAYTAGEPFGVATGVNISWGTAKCDIELTDTNPVFARVDLVSGANDREALFPEAPDVITLDTATTDDGTTTDTSVAGLKRVRVFRWAFNGDGKTSGFMCNTRRVVVDKVVDLGARTVLHEGDILDDGAFDLDWEYLSTEVTDDVTNVVYGIIFGNAEIPSSNLSSNLNIMCSKMIARSYDRRALRPTPTTIAPGVGQGVVYSAQPTFTWNMGQYSTYTAFRLQVLKGSTVVYDSNVRKAPVRDSHNNYNWTAPLYVDDQTPQGKVFANTNNYTWKVTMYNSKFKTDLYSAASGQFRMNVNATSAMNDSGYSSVGVAVKYFGPAEKVLAKASNEALTLGKIRVQAFSTPDFTGDPVSQTFVRASELETVSTTNLEVNATLTGLPAGTYYIRAYIDSDGDFQCSDWESAGHYCARAKTGTGTTMYTPMTVTVGEGVSKMPTASVFIEDQDTDGDWLPDAYEWEVAGSGTAAERLAKRGPATAADGFISVNTNLTTAIASRGISSVLSTQMIGMSVTDLASPSFAALLLGIDTTGYESDYAAVMAVANTTEIVDGSVVISGIALQGDSIVLSVGAETEKGTSQLSNAVWIYDLGGSDTVDVSYKLLYKASLSDSEWKTVKTGTITVGAEDKSVSVNVGDEIDLGSGFFKVELTK